MSAELEELIAAVDRAIEAGRKGAGDLCMQPRPRGIDAAGPYPDHFSQMSEWYERYDEAEKTHVIAPLEAMGARFTLKGAHEHRVRLGGFSASSTSSFTGALRNWQAGARKRLEAGT